jgi:hypothetical protein
MAKGEFLLEQYMAVWWLPVMLVLLSFSWSSSYLVYWNLGQLHNWVILHCCRRQLQVAYCWSRTWSYSSPDMCTSASSCLLELTSSYGKWCNC